MSNLFKKGFASLALASAMASSVFAGDAAYIDVKVNYLSGTGKAVLGYDSWDGTKSKYKAGARKDLVELYIRVLDKDGNLADKDKDSDQLLSMLLTRSGKTDSANNLRGSDTNGSFVTTATSTATHTISRSVVSNKNSARYTLDYTNQRVSSLVDNLIVKAGALSKSITIQLDTADATSLLVRATTKTSLDASFNGTPINSAFTTLRLLGDSDSEGGKGNLSIQSHSIPQITAGESVPLRIFASTAANNDNFVDFPASGRLTMAPNLKEAKIIVVAVGDYGSATTGPNGTANVYLGQTELTMKDGIAAGSIVVNYGLPERISTATDLASGHTWFDESNKSGGLGVIFIAYVKGESTINNYRPLRLSKGVLRTDTLSILGNNPSTDAVKVKSGDPVGFTGGTFSNVPSRGLASKLWTGNKTDIYVANDAKNGDSLKSDESIIITAVDKLGNPAILGTSIIGDKEINATFKVNGNDYSMTATSHFFVTNSMEMNTTGDFGLTSGTINVKDGNQTIARSSEITVSYSDGALAGLAPFKFNVHTVDLVGNTPSDVIGDLKKFVTVSVDNNTTDTAYRIHTEKSTKTDFDEIKVIAKVISASKENNFSTKFLFKAFNRKGEIDEGISFRDVKSAKTSGGSEVIIENNATEINMTGGTTGGVLALFTIKDINYSKTANIYTDLEGSSTTFILKGKGAGDTNATYRKFIDAYVATTTTTEQAKDFVGSESKPGKPGKTIIDFDFSGSLVEQFVGKAKAIITFGTDETNNSNSTIEAAANADIKVGVVGQPFVSTSTIEAAANTNVVTAIIPDNGRLSVVLYGTDSTDSSNTDVNKTQHSISSITINGFTPVYTSRNENKLTDAVDIDIAESNNSKAAHKKVTIAVGDVSTAAKIKIAGYNSSDSIGTANGNDLKNISSLPSNLIDPAKLEGKPSVFGTSPISTRSMVSVSTNTYYALFGSKANLTVLDAYGNKVKMKQTDLNKNYVLSVSDTECAEADMSKGDSAEKEAKPGYIYFKPCAAGKKIDLIITVSGNEEVKNTITFTNIVKKVENTAFMVSLNVGDADYNIVNNDVVVKVTPDGGTERSETVLTITSDNKDAKVKIVPVDLLTGREFGNMISGTTLKATISATGNYFVVTSDKPGKITVKADATIPSSESVSGEEVALTGTTSFTMVNVDTSAPTVTATSTSGSITVTVKDDGLDALATTVKVNNMTGTEMVVAEHTGNGVYVASNLKQGTYSIDIYAMDLSGNVHKQIIVQNVGAGALSVEEEATSMLLAKKEYTVMGTFTSHKFGDDNAKNWIYTRKSDDMSFQLLGETPSDKDIFGWKKTDAKASTSNVWYMIKTGEGSFDWALANADGVAYKLKGAKSDNTFDFSGRLNLNVSHKDGMLTFTAK